MAASPVSIVIPALNEGANLVDTVDVVLRNSGALEPEVIVVDDGSSDGAPQRVAARFGDLERVRVIHGPGEGIAAARNAGAAAAQGDVLVFLDGHCYVPPGWLEALIGPLRHADTAMAGPTFSSIREPRMVACGVTWEDAGLGNVWLPLDRPDAFVPFHIGACQAVRAEVFAEAGGFDRGMTRWGSEDIELCLRLWLLGYEVRAARDSLVYHLFRTSRPYEVDVGSILYNHLRMALLHFDEARLEQVIARVMRFDGAESCLARAFANGVSADRAALMARRRRDLDWLFGRFGIGF